MGFAQKLQQLRREKGLSQEDLANAFDVTRQAVSKWESGQAYPEVEKLLQIRDFFGVSLDELLRPEGAGAEATSQTPPQEPPAPEPEWREPEPTQAPPGGGLGAGAPLSEESIRGFLSEQRQQAQMIAVGVGVLIASLCPLMWMGGIWGVTLFLLCIAVGVAALVYTSYLPHQYRWMKRGALQVPAVMLEDFRRFAEEKRRQYGRYIALGVLLEIGGLVTLVGSFAFPRWLRGFIRGMSPVCWAGGVMLFIYAGVNTGALNTITRG